MATGKRENVGGTAKDRGARKSGREEHGFADGEDSVQVIRLLDERYLPGAGLACEGFAVQGDLESVSSEN